MHAMKGTCMGCQTEGHQNEPRHIITVIFVQKWHIFARQSQLPGILNECVTNTSQNVLKSKKGKKAIFEATCTLTHKDVKICQY